MGRRAHNVSELQRNYRGIVNEAKDEGSASIIDSDGTMLYLADSQDVEVDRRVSAELAAFARLSKVIATHEGAPSSEWAAQTEYPWLAAFPSKEIAEFRSDLIESITNAATLRDLRVLEGNLRAWENTAAIYNDPELMAKLLAVGNNFRDCGAVPPPTDEQLESDRLRTKS